MKAIFQQIYADNVWGRGSGEGSRPAHARGYVEFLQRFLRERRIRSVVDFGCGDWQFSRLVDWSGVDYLGCDIVPGVVRENERRFGAANVRFRELADACEPLPAADLLLVKDVLQHWSNEEIAGFLPRLAAYRYALVTNCVARSGPTVNRDVRTGDFRPVDLREPPFALPAFEVYRFEGRRPLLLRPFAGPRWRKTVLLLEDGGRPR